MNKAASVQTVNTDQAAAWNGDEGRNWTEHADQYNRATQRHRQRLLDANLFNPGDIALDIGCGTGKAARDVANSERHTHPSSRAGPYSRCRLGCRTSRPSLQGAQLRHGE